MRTAEPAGLTGVKPDPDLMEWRHRPLLAGAWLFLGLVAREQLHDHGWSGGYRASGPVRRHAQRQNGV
nr:hypothetical protein [Actinomadura sp. HBU206391]